MEIKKGLTDRLDSVEEEESKQENLLAFWDFCLDFLGRADCICLPQAGFGNTLRREANHE